MSAADDLTAVERSTRIVLRPIANPLPLGFFALAAGTFVLSGLQLGWVPPKQGTDVALIIGGLVFPLQLLASILGFHARDVVAATGMGILAGTWLSIALVLYGSQPGSTSDALGLLLGISAVAMCVVAVGALFGKVVPALVLATTALRFSLTSAYQLTDSSTWKTAAGVAGLALCAIAVYAAAAMLIEDVRKGALLPLARRGAGATSFDGNLDDQLRRLDREAGVREQL